MAKKIRITEPPERAHSEASNIQKLFGIKLAIEEELKIIPLAIPVDKMDFTCPRGRKFAQLFQGSGDNNKARIVLAPKPSQPLPVQSGGKKCDLELFTSQLHPEPKLIDIEYHPDRKSRTLQQRLLNTKPPNNAEAPTPVQLQASKQTDNGDKTATQAPKAQRLTSLLVKNLNNRLIGNLLKSSGKSPPSSNRQSKPAAAKSVPQPATENIVSQRSSPNIVFQPATESIMSRPASEKVVQQPARTKVTQSVAENIVSRAATAKMLQPATETVVPRPSSSNFVFQPATEKIIPRPATEKVVHQPLPAKAPQSATEKFDIQAAAGKAVQLPKKSSTSASTLQTATGKLIQIPTNSFKPRLSVPQTENQRSQAEKYLPALEKPGLTVMSVERKVVDGKFVIVKKIVKCPKATEGAVRNTLIEPPQRNTTSHYSASTPSSRGIVPTQGKEQSNAGVSVNSNKASATIRKPDHNAATQNLVKFPPILNYKQTRPLPKAVYPGAKTVPSTASKVTGYTGVNPHNKIVSPTVVRLPQNKPVSSIAVPLSQRGYSIQQRWSINLNTPPRATSTKFGNTKDTLVKEIHNLISTSTKIQSKTLPHLKTTTSESRPVPIKDALQKYVALKSTVSRNFPKHNAPVTPKTVHKIHEIIITTPKAVIDSGTSSSHSIPTSQSAINQTTPRTKVFLTGNNNLSVSHSSNSRIDLKKCPDVLDHSTKSKASTTVGQQTTCADKTIGDNLNATLTSTGAPSSVNPSSDPVVQNRPGQLGITTMTKPMAAKAPQPSRPTTSAGEYLAIPRAAVRESDQASSSSVREPQRNPDLVAAILDNSRATIADGDNSSEMIELPKDLVQKYRRLMKQAKSDQAIKTYVIKKAKPEEKEIPQLTCTKEFDNESVSDEGVRMSPKKKKKRRRYESDSEASEVGKIESEEPPKKRSLRKRANSICYAPAETKSSDEEDYARMDDQDPNQKEDLKELHPKPDSAKDIQMKVEEQPRTETTADAEIKVEEPPRKIRVYSKAVIKSPADKKSVSKEQNRKSSGDGSRVARRTFTDYLESTRLLEKSATWTPQEKMENVRVVVKKLSMDDLLVYQMNAGFSQVSSQSTRRRSERRQSIYVSRICEKMLNE